MGDPLKPIFCTDETAKNFVEKFCGHIHWLTCVRYVFKVLFEDERFSCRILMEKTAPAFFNDLGRILQEYLLLESAKITDRAATLGHNNFTVDFLVNRIKWPNDTQEKLNQLQKDIENFVGSKTNGIRKARNKLLAHYDLDTVLSEEVCGEFSEGEDKIFFTALQELCDTTHEACFGTIYGEMILTGPGDIHDLTHALTAAIAFNKALSEGSDQTQTFLLSCFNQTQQKTA